MVLPIGSEGTEAPVLDRARKRGCANDLSLLWHRRLPGAVNKQPTVENRMALKRHFHKPHLHAGMRYAPMAKSVRSSLDRLVALENELRGWPKHLDTWQA